MYSPATNYYEFRENAVETLREILGEFNNAVLNLDWDLIGERCHDIQQLATFVVASEEFEEAGY